MKHRNPDPTKPRIISGPTGPKTESGQQRSSQNSTRHGCCSTTILILPNETLEDFKALERTWFSTPQAKDGIEIQLLHELVQAAWFLHRATRNLAQVEAQITLEQPNPLEWSGRHHQAIRRFARYQTARRNEFGKASKAVNDHRKQRAAATTQTEKSTIAQERLRIYAEKNKPKPSLELQFAELQRTADLLGIKHVPLTPLNR